MFYISVRHHQFHVTSGFLVGISAETLILQPVLFLEVSTATEDMSCQAGLQAHQLVEYAVSGLHLSEEHQFRLFQADDRPLVIFN